MYLKFGKRGLDLLGSLLGLILCLPILVLIGIWIKTTGSGPIFFRQARLGRYGQKFTLLKFRTMNFDKEIEGKQFTPGDQSQVTRCGKILRKTKLDELPELLNVLRGEMGLVGPRPEVPRYEPFFRGEFSQVLGIRPGITDFASIQYRDEEEILSRSIDPEWTYVHEILPDKLRMNVSYSKRVCLRVDLQILFLTLRKLLC
jgi:lipopolysaccharide/colanic/teichoic acid biosynthesis glycosyltransferase